MDKNYFKKFKNQKQTKKKHAAPPPCTKNYLQIENNFKFLR